MCLTHSEAPQTKHWSLEQRHVYQWAKQGEWAARARKTQTLSFFREEGFFHFWILFVILGLHLWHMDVPRLGVELEL